MNTKYSYRIKRTDTNEYETNAEVDPLDQANWSKDKNNAYIWRDVSLAGWQSSDYRKISIPTVVEQVEGE